MRYCLISGFMAIFIAFSPVISKAAGEIEFLHWWTAGGEAAALAVVKNNLQDKGVSWIDLPIAGGSGVQAMTVLRSRFSAGKPPAAAQLLGYDITALAKENFLADLNSLAENGNWNEVFPEPLQNFAKYDGKWVGVPINIHTTNWVWANKSIFDENKLVVPKNWNEFARLIEKLKGKGITPIAHGGQAWQDATVFESFVITAGGPEFYKKAFIDLDDKALGSREMEKAFDYLRYFRKNLDPNFSGRDWNLATAMVINGEAAMQIMGDWAKGEFVNAKKVAGKDYLCFRVPGTEGSITFNGDLFAMPKVGSDQLDAQNTLASVIADKNTQVEFNKIKGSVPARKDVSDAGFDACGKKGIADVKSTSVANTMLGSLAHGYAAKPAVKNAVFDVVTNFFNSTQNSRDAVKDLVQAVNLAK